MPISKSHVPMKCECCDFIILERRGRNQPYPVVCGDKRYGSLAELRLERCPEMPYKTFTGRLVDGICLNLTPREIRRATFRRRRLEKPGTPVSKDLREQWALGLVFTILPRHEGPQAKVDGHF